jgi:pimeloyl-ACP methyl ester carboxylesterase
MIHGFGGNGATFYKMIVHLMKTFRVTTMDLFGMAGSGRPPFSLTSAPDCIDFFVFSIEAWMKATRYNESENYYLLGPSLGGYLCACYALRYPEKITKLILMSPVGVPHKPEGHSVETVAQRQTSKTASFMFRRVGQLWDYNIGVFTILRKSGYYGANKLMTGFVNRRLKLPSAEESEVCKELLI